jgi:uncharacterized repeat protein (TIGR02543 family)
MKRFLVLIAALSATIAVGCSNIHSNWNSLNPLLYLNFLSYNVTFDSQGGSPVADRVVAYNGFIPEPAIPTKTGYNFNGWHKDSLYTTDWDFDNDRVTESLSLYAQWDTYSYPVHFDCQDCTTPPDPAGTTVESPAISVGRLPVQPIKDGFYFAGWYTEVNGEGAEFIDTTIVHEELTVFALWSANPPHTVTFDGDSATTGAIPANKTVVSPEITVGTLPATDPTKTGYIFGGWYTEKLGAGTPFLSTTAVSSDITVYAKWNNYSYTVTFDSQDATVEAEPANKTVSSPAVNVGALPTDPIKDGYTFGGWWTEINGEGTQFNAGTSVVSDLSVYAAWNPTDNTVTFSAAESTGGSMPAQTIATGETAALTENAYSRAGYGFSGWATTPGGPVEYENGSDYSMGTASVTLYAAWSPNNYQVSFAANNGSGSMTPQTIACDATAALTTIAFARDGYTFAGWATAPGGAIEYADGASFIMGTESITLYAKWTPVTYNITYGLNGGINNSGNPATYTIETATIDLLEPTRPGYNFTGWSPSSSIPSGSTGDRTFTASWIIRNPVVTYKGNGNTGGSVPDPCSYATNTLVIVSANSGNLVRIPAVGTAEAYKFGGWNTQPDGKGTTYAAGTGTFTLTGDTTLYAKWIPFAVGDTGPGGGIVFYDKGFYYAGSRYIEIAPAGWSGGEDPSSIWSTVTYYLVQTCADVGKARYNSDLILSQNGGAECAASVARSYHGGGLNDWGLPTYGDMYFFCASGLKESVGGIGGIYWCSTEYSGYYVYRWDMDAGIHITPMVDLQGMKYNSYKVRPVRSF